jgi:hypothetical protein
LRLKINFLKHHLAVESEQLKAVEAKKVKEQITGKINL